MKTAMITGASRGIGRAILEALATEYDAIAICGREEKTLQEAIHEEWKAKIYPYCLDVSDYIKVSNMVADFTEKCGGVDLLINNAGISKVGLLTDMKIEEWNEIIGVNLTSVFNTCQTVVPYMVTKKMGRIINISSVWGNVGASCEVAYSATKGGVNSFTKALAKELAPSNIAVNAVAFGCIDTSMNGHLNEEERNVLEEEIPFGRMATPAEAAACVKTLSEMPVYFTGEIVKFDGAWI